MINVKSSKDFRAKIQNGFWGFKLLALVGLIVGAFFIPENGFSQTFMIFGMVGGFLVRRNKFVHEYSTVFFVFSSY